MIGIIFNLLKENIKEDKMHEYTNYLRWQARRNLLRAHGEELNKGIIAKLTRKIRKYEENM